MATEPGIVDKIVRVHDALDAARLPHAFGGALALAWCTQQARGTIDIDLNVFVDSARAAEVLDALPAEVAHAERDLEECVRTGQVRLWWGVTPIDVFTNTTEFHRAVAERAVQHEFASRNVPFLCCTDLAVFKAFFDRTRDWADIEAMLEMSTVDVDLVLGALVHYLGPDDRRIARMRAAIGA